jgi:hypothetical protein
VQTFFTNAYNIAKDVVGIIWALGGVIMAVFTASQTPLSENKNILQLIKDKLNEWKAWLEDPENGLKIKKWFDDAKRLAQEIWQGVEDIIAAFQRWNTDENREGLKKTIDGMGTLLTTTMNLVTWIERLYQALDVILNPLGTFMDIANGNVPSWVVTLIGKVTGIKPNIVPNTPTDYTKTKPTQKFARGGLVGTPTYALIGEAGPEAVIPLRRPIGAMDPAVRQLALTIRSSEEPKGGKRVQVTQNIYPSQADPSNVANSVLRQLTYAAGR